MKRARARRGHASRKPKQKARPKIVLAIVSFPGNAKNGSDTEWHLAADGDTTKIGCGNGALLIALEAWRLLMKEAAQIPTSESQHDAYFRQWMLDLAVHKAAIGLSRPLPSVAMYYLVGKVNEWGVTLAETAKQLLKRDALPRQQKEQVT